MSDEQLLRYKAAFSNADLDEDGLLDVPQAMKALQSCGVPVTSNAMLDTLDELEVAQEDSLRSSEWEMEQGRRRRRRRRNSLESIENEQIIRSSSLGREAEEAASGAETDDAKRPPYSAAAAAPQPRRGRRPLNNAGTFAPELDRASSHSSLRSPSIDISTFLSLLNRRSRGDASPSRGYSGPSSRGGNAAAHNNNRAHVLPSPTLARAGSGPGVGPSSRNPLSSPPHQSQPQQAAWERQGYQAASSAADAASGATTQTGRPFSNVGLGGVAATNSPRLFPSLRLRDPSSSEARLQSIVTPLSGGGIPPTTLRQPSISIKPSPATAPPGVLDDDDDDEFNPEADLLAAFHTFDPSHSGSMSVPHLQAILTHMGEKWTPEEAAEMVEEVDQQGEGRFNYRQLVHRLMARE